MHNAYVHLDGWGARGYDNVHPDPLPPAERAGGWAGLRALADTADELGYTLILHDQYRDYYLDAPSYSPEWAVVDEQGKRPSHALWAGGQQELLCSHFAKVSAARAGSPQRLALARQRRADGRRGGERGQRAGHGRGRQSHGFGQCRRQCGQRRHELCVRVFGRPGSDHEHGHPDT